MDKIIEIARFTYAADAEVLASLLRSEGIECHVKNGISSSMLFGSGATGGARVELLYGDAAHAVEIMHDHDYEVAPDILELISNSETGNNDYGKQKRELSRTMTLIMALLAIVLIALFFLNRHFNG